MDDVLSLATGFAFVTFVHVKIVANILAHKLVKLGASSIREHIWME